MLKTLLVFCLISGVTLLSGGRAMARPIRIGSLDSDATAKNTIIVGTITRVRASPPANKRQRLQPVTLTVRVKAAIRLANGPSGKPPSSITVAHSRRLPSRVPAINAFTPVRLSFGRTYLLFLTRTKSRQSYRLVAPEDPYLIEFKPALSWIWRQYKKQGSVLQNVAPLLENLLLRCYWGCHQPIWLLGNSRGYRKLLSRRGRRARFLKQLRSIAAASTDSNTLLAAYTVLGQLGDRSVIKHIVRYACRPPRRNRPVPPSAAIGWLQGYGELVQIKAMKRMLRCTRNRYLRRDVRSAIKRVWSNYRSARRP